MVLAFSEVRRVVERVCVRQDVLDACAKRDLGFAIAVLNENGVTQGQIASLTGLHQNRLSDYKTGKHRPTVTHAVHEHEPGRFRACSGGNGSDSRRRGGIATPAAVRLGHGASG